MPTDNFKVVASGSLQRAAASINDQNVKMRKSGANLVGTNDISHNGVITVSVTVQGIRNSDFSSSVFKGQSKNALVNMSGTTDGQGLGNVLGSAVVK